MSKKHKALLLIVLASLAAFAYLFMSHADSMAVLNPQGVIAQQQRNLIVFTALMSLLIVLPVFFMTFWFAWRYREGSTQKVKYQPDWDHSALFETIWWAVPTIMILVLAGITWKSSHDLDPFRPIVSSKPPMTIQVVALDWKWLFIYPQQQIASVNYVQFPEKTPIKFEITSDAPMNSFWIPQLGGQIYAMTGMSTHLNLMANSTGTYRGSSANISGRGFSGMNFTARSSTQAGFDWWVRNAKSKSTVLSLQKYDELAKPSQNNPIKIYSKVDPVLYDTIVMKYMSPISPSAEAVNLEAE